MFSRDPSVLVGGTQAHRRRQDYERVLGGLDVVVGTSRLWRVYLEASRLIRARKYDIITVQAPDELGLIGFYFSRRYDIPLQIQIHTDILSPWYWRASWKERIRYWTARFLVPRADCIRVVSRRIERSLLQAKLTASCSKLSLQQNQKVTVLPIFTDIQKFLAASSGGATDARFRDYSFKMIAVGRFVDKEKNFSMLIEVMRDFVKVCPKALLVIVGDGPDRENYELRIMNYGLQKNVKIEPWREDLPSFYKSFDLYLMSSNYEGWGRTVIEAMAAGLPVLMTDTGLAGEVVENGGNGVIVPVADKDAFLRELKELYNNEEKRKRLGRETPETAKNLKPRTKEEYLKLYRESFASCLK